MPAQDAGKWNPGGLFRSVSGDYIFNLKLVDAMGNGLAAGDYTLFYTIGDDPTLQHVQLLGEEEATLFPESHCIAGGAGSGHVFSFFTQETKNMA